MIFSLIFLLIFVVLVALFIGKNLGNSCAIWFFKDYGQTNIVVIIFIAFAAGIVTSLLLIFIGKCIKQIKISDKSVDNDRKSKRKRDRSQKVSEEIKNPDNNEINEKENQFSAENESK